MRSENEIMSLILNVAKTDNRIRVVFLNGSRANPNAKKDILQDYDIVYVVRAIESFLSDHNWIDIFGERLILQIPEEMILGNEEKDNEAAKSVAFPYLMLFEDGNRIDLTLLPIEELENEFELDSLSVLLMDKDNLFPDFPTSSDLDYLIRKPTEKEFLDCCNEFWWVSAYVAKGLWRGQILYAKDMLEYPVRAMFMKMIEWHIGTKTNFLVSFGKSGKNIEENIHPLLWNRILATYPNAEPENIWNSLFLMLEIFRELATKISNQLQFNYNFKEDEKITQYLKGIMTLSNMERNK